MTSSTKKTTQSIISTTGTYGSDYLEVYSAREHNLKNINVKFPRNKLVVITGVSGSGKSSLAFDTLYAEGRRRYMESFSAYARNFMGNISRPDVDKITGLSPVVAIEQKTTSRNPRSTVGTMTEIYDFLRLLFARAAEAYSYLSGEKMIKQSDEQMHQHILKKFVGQQLILLSPLVKGRKGHYKKLFQRLRKLGFSKVRINGKIESLSPRMQVDRYKTHNIELVIDYLAINSQEKQRLRDSLCIAWQQSKGVAMVQDEKGKLHYFSQSLMDPTTGLSYDEPAPNTFSFNSPYGACTNCNGLGEVTEINQAAIIPDVNLSISRGGIVPLGAYKEGLVIKKIEALLKQYELKISTPIKDIPKKVLSAILYGDNTELEIDSVKYPGTKWYTQFEGVIPLLKRKQEIGSEKMRSSIQPFLHALACPACQGMRLKKEALHFRVDHKSIAELAAMNMQQLYDWLLNLEDRLNARQRRIATELLKEVRKRIRSLLDVGLHYLCLNRPLKTLSGGEAQRIRLATQIGTQLVGVLYILDEPSIGLHQRDNLRLINALKCLRDLGNSVIVVEHDKDMMQHADYLVEIGPGAGRHGGGIVAAGTLEKFLQQPSTTANFLTGKYKIDLLSQQRKGNKKYITLQGCTGNNLKDATLQLPLGKLVCVTGVSGSGKSTLIHETLAPILRQHFYNAVKGPLSYKAIDGLKNIDKVVEVDQSPIGRTPRSNPATYTGIFADIRNLFTLFPESKIRGYKAGRFSFNVKGGRCETCEGGGMRLIEMEFLANVHVLCENCNGQRYNRETLAVQYKSKSIADVLNMTIDTAVEFFEKHPKILRIAQTLQAVGLGYITLGQHATTLSGGEAQRVKLATELAKKDTGNTLYILDEPTTGLHFQDITYLLKILNRLVDQGNTVLIIEHNLDIIKAADWVIDLGPEGGVQGGEIICEGLPQDIIQQSRSYTAQFLKKELRDL